MGSTERRENPGDLKHPEILVFDFSKAFFQNEHVG